MRHVNPLLTIGRYQLDLSLGPEEILKRDTAQGGRDPVFGLRDVARRDEL